MPYELLSEEEASHLIGEINRVRALWNSSWTFPTAWRELLADRGDHFGPSTPYQMWLEVTLAETMADQRRLRAQLAKDDEIQYEMAVKIAQPEQRMWKVSYSEGGELGEDFTSERVIEEVHNVMCTCGTGDPENCETPGIVETLLQCATALLVGGEWLVDFEDGWIGVEARTEPQQEGASLEIAEAIEEHEWVRMAGALIDTVEMTAEDYQNEEVVEFLKRNFRLAARATPSKTAGDEGQ